MKKLSNDIRLVNIFFVISFLLIYILFSFYVSYQLRTEQKKSIQKLKKFILNEKMSFENNKESDVKSFINDVYSDQIGNNDFSINLRYNGIITAQNNAFIRNFNLQNNKIIRVGNFYVLNFKIFIKTANQALDVQIVNDFSQGLSFIKKIKIVFFIFLMLLFLLSIGITKGFYNKLKMQIELLKNTTNNIELNNFESIKLENKDFYSEFEAVLETYKIMLKKIKMQTELEMEFVNNASHELKTPIFIIGGYADLLDKMGARNPEIFRESVSVIKSTTKEMTVLTEKLLFLAKKEYNEVNYELVNIKETLSLIIEEMKILYPECKVNIIGKPFNTNSDSKLLKQLFRNIIENSIKYGNNSIVEVFLTENSDIYEKKVVIKDAGLGMNEDELKNAFNKFYRSSKQKNSSSKGHGLGLNIVKLIADLLNISVNITSKKNSGTTVTISFLSTNMKKQ